jgi:heme exporter protein CcmD
MGEAGARVSWDALCAFLAMGGYAPFVWGSYGVAALCIAVEISFVLRRLRKSRAAGANTALASA